MNRFIILITIFFVLASFATSTPLRRHDDPLSGFKQCSGYFPNYITKFDYTPDPVLVDHNITVCIGGKATEVIESGAEIVFTWFLDDKEVFRTVFDFCDYFVEQSGYSCPVEKGHFEFSSTWFEPSTPEDPKDTVVDYKIKVESA